MVSTADIALAAFLAGAGYSAARWLLDTAEHYWRKRTVARFNAQQLDALSRVSQEQQREVPRNDGGYR